VNVDTTTTPPTYQIRVSWVEAGETVAQSFTLNMQI
jgi:hypothetical protein